MSPRPNVTDERTSQIINAAEDVFTKKGFDEARMDDIAEADRPQQRHFIQLLQKQG